MSDRPTGLAPSRLAAVLGPTNTGKTHYAVERMLGHASGMIGLPLRLLAREVYDRIVRLKGPRSVALITGEEKIAPPRAQYFVCTVEAMPLNRTVEFLAVDEIQLCSDPERGHIFTHRLLNARGRSETLFLGAAAMAPLIRRLLPEAEFVTRERLSSLTYAGSKKLTRLPRRTAVVAFSAEAVYGIAELIRRQRGGAAVVMGSLSPRTRNAQVALYQSGEVDFLVATDAIGMGLNMDVDHVAFAGLRKFDGRRTRWLHAAEVGQIAGRAGRYRSDGAFGVTGDCPDLDPDLIEAVEGHHYPPVESAEWRNSQLDFSGLPALLRSLGATPPQAGLKLSAEALDETTLRRLAAEPEIAARARNRAHLFHLWDACQIPDFRKTTREEHERLVRSVFDHLSGPHERISEDWIAPQHRALDRTDGGIEALAQRLASVRTLTYVANRAEWLERAAHWQGATRALEDRLSDTLHERLMQRFIDRRTSVLMRALNVRDGLVANVDAQGQVSIDGAIVGTLSGVRFDLARGASTLEDKALRAAAQRAVAPELGRRLGRLAAAPDAAFRLRPDGEILFEDEPAGRIDNDRPFAPLARLHAEMGPQPALERAQRRLEAFAAAEAARSLAALRRLESSIADGALKGLARGVAHQLLQAGGAIARQRVAQDLAALSQVERRTLRALGVRIGGGCVFMPALLKKSALDVAQAFTRRLAQGARLSTGLRRMEGPALPDRLLAAHGMVALDSLAAPIEAVEALAARLRAAPRRDGGVVLDAEAMADKGWTGPDCAAVLRALGYAPAGKHQAGGERLWRRRRVRSIARDAAAPFSPFGRLSALRPVLEDRRPTDADPREAPRRRRRGRRQGRGLRKTPDAVS